MKEIFVLAFMVLTSSAIADIQITSWNIEHLGSNGRGFGGGFGGGDLPARTDDQLADIGKLINKTLKSDIVAFQEVSIDYIDDGESRSERLDKIINAMGSNWKYYLPPQHRDHHDESMYVGYLWNCKTVNAIKTKPLFVPNLTLAGKGLFDRTPVIGYFETIRDDGSAGNDFALINVHLASGQHNDENHLIAMTLIEYRLNKAFKAIKIKESDRIILGDFNDNPYTTNSNGTKIRTNALYQHMAFKGYSDLVTEDFHSTRMDGNLNSIIDHILVNNSAKRDIAQNKADVYLPSHGDSSKFAEWRVTYSDHFPISFKIAVRRDNDVDW